MLEHDRFQEIEFFKDSPDGGLQVRRIFYSFLLAGVELPPKTVIWRPGDRIDSSSDSDGEVAEAEISTGYYLFKWDRFLLLLYPNGTGEICSFPGPISHEFSSEEEIIRHVQKNSHVYDLSEQ